MRVGVGECGLLQISCNSSARENARVHLCAYRSVHQACAMPNA